VAPNQRVHAAGRHVTTTACAPVAPALTLAADARFVRPLRSNLHRKALGVGMARLDLIGACVAQVIFLVTIAVFVCRLAGQARAEWWLGVVLLLTAVPLAYLLLQAPQYARPRLYYVQIGLMLGYLAVELILDYVAKIEFRQVRWMVIGYVVLFFAGTGGMIGVASRAGRLYAVSSVILFLVMATLAFVQRGVTGM